MKVAFPAMRGQMGNRTYYSTLMKLNAVPKMFTFTDWIEDLSNRGIAAGCGGGNFCPTNPTTRGQMAPFLSKTFGLLLYGP